MKIIGMLTLCAAVAGLIGFAAAAEKEFGAYELTVLGARGPMSSSAERPSDRG